MGLSIHGPEVLNGIYLLYSALAHFQFPWTYVRFSLPWHMPVLHAWERVQKPVLHCFTSKRHNCKNQEKVTMPRKQPLNRALSAPVVFNGSNESQAKEANRSVNDGLKESLSLQHRNNSLNTISFTYQEDLKSLQQLQQTGEKTAYWDQHYCKDSQVTTEN